MSIITKIVLSLLSSTGTPAASPDLCDVVYPETGTPTICKPHRTYEVPVLDADVCCAATGCVLAPPDGCVDNDERYHCDYGETDTMGNAVCYYQVPDYCDAYPCAQFVGEQEPQADWVCCSFGICEDMGHYIGYYCDVDDIYWCEAMAQFPDGTVDCGDIPN